MILHSVAPLQCLLPPDENPPEESLAVPGATLLGRKTAEGFLISRVVSTDPQAYLNGALGPGSLYTGAAQPPGGPGGARG